MSSNPNTEQNLDYESGTASVVEMHDSVKRENPIPPSGKEPLGITALVLCAITLVFGGIVFGYSNGFDGTIYKHSGYTPDPRPGSAAGAGQEDDSPWIDKWMKGGKKIYNNCLLCHGATGLGVPGQYPPLAGSEWVDGGTDRLGAILMNGITGPLSVAGKQYNQAMPAWNALGNDQIAQVITYIRRTWGNLPEGDDGVVTEEMIQNARAKYGSNSVWTEAGLLEIPEDAMLEGAKVDLQTGEPIQ